jgi:hypothetical protein
MDSWQLVTPVSWLLRKFAMLSRHTPLGMLPMQSCMHACELVISWLTQRVRGTYRCEVCRELVPDEAAVESQFRSDVNFVMLNIESSRRAAVPRLAGCRASVSLSLL